MGRLARLGFTDAAVAAERLAGLDLLTGPAGADVVDALAEADDPDAALASLVHLVEASRTPAALLRRIAAEPGLRRRLTAVLGASIALGDHLARHPADLEVLADDSAVFRRPTLLGLRRDLLTAVGADPDDPFKPPAAADMPTGGPVTRATDDYDALRAAHRRALLALAARDLTGLVTVDEVAAELADLASAALDAALATAYRRLPPNAVPASLAVIGMGKCGGRELNYVSDVDVVLVAGHGTEATGPDGDGTGPDEAGALHTATVLATGLVQACGATTAEGVMFPVDLGLRPEGRLGPLVRTLASHEAYYRRWARTWEFQALLKARPVAGDLRLGEQYMRTITPLVWTAAARPGFVEDVQEMRRRVERSLSADSARRELKLGPGGLRDVEFAVQLLQLVHGRADPSLRSVSTLPALAALSAGGYVAREDAERLDAAYRWLRTAEHRLQLTRLRRTHSVPTDPADLRRLARGLGYRRDPVAEFEADRARRVTEVRRLHEKLLYRPLLDAVARLPAEHVRLTPQAARERLTALGFDDPVGALRHLEALTAGLSRRASIQRTLLPAMLGWFADAAEPDQGLLAYRRVSDALGDTPWYLRLLRDEGDAAQRLARLLATSRYVTDLITRAPEGIAVLARDEDLVPRTREQVGAELLAVVERNTDDETAVVAARGVRRHELLRVACADLLGKLGVAEAGQALSDVACATVSAALRTARRTVERRTGGPLPVRLAVIAMGRLGGGELAYASDADVLFVHEAAPGVADAAAAKVAHAVAEETRRLLALPAPDPALLIDADLRPEGRHGPLTRSLASYAAYYDRWMATWEAQALLRAAPGAGDAELTARFLDMVAPLRYPDRFDGADEVRRLKGRMEAERLPRGPDRLRDLKLGPGGLSDVEWTVQLLQLRHAAAIPALRTTGTLAALAAAREAGLLAPDDAAVLGDAWRAAALARDAIMLVTGRRADRLPRDARTLTAVARAVGASAEGGLGAGQLWFEGYRGCADAARSVVERAFWSD